VNIEMVGVDTLIPYVNNARMHSDEQVTQIASSIKEFGFNVPILIDKDKGIIAGHGRLMAAKKLGHKEVPTIRLEHLSEVQKKAYILADNKIALNSTWDTDLLRLELNELDVADYKLEMTGFTSDELTKVLFGDLIEPKSPEDFKDVNESDMQHKCPRCGFEFDE
jgi:ParB-like chromosome segregation protein Spo0J